MANFSLEQKFAGKERNAMLNFTSMTTRLGFVMICVSFVTTLCTGGVFVWYTFQENKQNLLDYRSELEDELDSRLASETQIAVSMVQKFYSMQQAGQLTETQAKGLAANFVRDLRYDEGNGYFWNDPGYESGTSRQRRRQRWFRTGICLCRTAGNSGVLSTIDFIKVDFFKKM